MLTNSLVYGFAQNGGKKWGGVQLNQPLTVGIKQYSFAQNDAKPFVLYTGDYNLIGFGVGVNQYNYNTWDAGLIDYCFGVGRDLSIRFVGSINFKIGSVDKTFNFDKLLSYGQFTNYVQYNDSPMCGFDVDELFSYSVGQSSYVTISVSGSITVGVDQCQHLPDGQAAITLIYEQYGTGQKSAIQRNFNFNDQLTVIDFFNGWNDNPCYGLGSGDFVIVGYRIKASQGFTSGVFRVLETWTKIPSYVIEDAVYDRGSVTVPEGKTSAFCSVNKQARTYLTEFLSGGIPEYFTGRIRLECNFAEQKCLDEIIDVPAVTDEEFINTNVFDNSVDISIGQLIVDVDQVTEQLTQITEPIPPDEPETGCECEKYQAKLIYEGLKYIQKTLDVRLSQYLIVQNEANKRLVESLVTGLKPLITTEQEPRGIADVLNEKEFDPFIMVDTNEAFYKKLMPPEGNAWIGDMP